jgi:hemoglobin
MNHTPLPLRLLPFTLFTFTFTLLTACGETTRQDRSFFTSGSREADQRAEQRMAKAEQLRGNVGSNPADPKGDETTPAKKSLYERLGGEAGVTAIIDDFVTRSLADPRVNWERKAVSGGGVLSLGKKPDPWPATAENVKKMKQHIAQFLAVATGGPTTYGGRNMTEVHKGMRISNAEFDAAVGDLKATLDKLRIGIDEQKELLAIIESTRPQVVEAR